jgi:hypothetical protein
MDHLAQALVNRQNISGSKDQTIMDLVRKHLSLNGGISGSYKDQDGIQSRGIGGGGRVGLNFPMGGLNFRGGLSGNFNDWRAEFDTDRQNMGAPDQVNGGGGQLTGRDFGVDFPGGFSLGAEYNTPSKNEREYMLRFKKNF